MPWVVERTKTYYLQQCVCDVTVAAGRERKRPEARREHSAETEQNEGKENLGKPAEAFKNQTPSKP